MILGGHGITAWGRHSDECEARSLEIIATAQKFIDERGSHASVRRNWSSSRCRRPSAGRGPQPSPRCIRGLASTDKPQLGHFSDHPAVLEFAGSERLAGSSPRSARPAPTTSCAPRCGRWCSTCRRTRRSTT